MVGDPGKKRGEIVFQVVLKRRTKDMTIIGKNCIAIGVQVSEADSSLSELFSLMDCKVLRVALLTTKKPCRLDRGDDRRDPGERMRDTVRRRR